MSEINVVPYVDVMLVLLVIFMVTAPLLTQGVKVDLPQASAEPIEQEELLPFVLSVDAQGQYYLDSENNKRVNEAQLVNAAKAKLRRNPRTPFLLRGDAAVPYVFVVKAMALLQSVGVESVGLVSEAPES